VPVAATIADMKLTVNGTEVEVDDRHAQTPLLWVLRDVLELRGTKFGCGAGFCAACTVLIDGRNAKSWQTATERVVDRSSPWRGHPDASSTPFATRGTGATSSSAATASRARRSPRQPSSSRTRLPMMRRSTTG
jgi:ferredoxin